MKKFIIAFIALAVSLTFSGCTQTPKIRILNWGEYINDEVVANFEREYGVNVVVDTADSNELFYSKIKSKTTAYDLVIPSDYMIEKMVS
ncbi:MAG TPA: spermidine/putrescine ABC transporter substrate-binding protein, partial [Candidatus Izemoplasmatales bacterium]|nr:spermidine/putrescine ABC transporter substrate-binding protein [Candidatus Izemoplasmatales bacterium]